MNIEDSIRTNKKIPLTKKTIIHLMMVSNAVSESIALTLKPFDVSIQQFNVLRILRGQNGEAANLSTINSRMVTKMSNTTRLVDKLLAKNYVDRSVCSSNRRKVEIRITSKGLEALGKMDIVIADAEHTLVQKFNQEELLELNRLLDKF